MGWRGWWLEGGDAVVPSSHPVIIDLGKFETHSDAMLLTSLKGGIHPQKTRNGSPEWAEAIPL